MPLFQERAPANPYLQEFGSCAQGGGKWQDWHIEYKGPYGEPVSINLILNNFGELSSKMVAVKLI